MLVLAKRISGRALSLEEYFAEDPDKVKDLVAGLAELTVASRSPSGTTRASTSGRPRARALAT